jgi:hypothetical protein
LPLNASTARPSYRRNSAVFHRDRKRRAVWSGYNPAKDNEGAEDDDAQRRRHREIGGQPHLCDTAVLPAPAHASCAASDAHPQLNFCNAVLAKAEGLMAPPIGGDSFIAPGS